MVTVETFRASFPEFADAPADAVVQRCLDLAALHVGGFPSGDVRDLAQQYYAAHIVTRDPRGHRTAKRPVGNASTIQMAALQVGARFDKGTSDYLQAFLDLRAAYIIPLYIV
jgi:hypothetical protein